MQDFVRIGGEITSSPLNENFRRLLNAISIANTNLVFPEQNAVVDTIDDMNAIENPDNAQTCYVVSSGELYRYTKKDNKWVKIADFGQTFRQGFLNSGAVVLEDYITLKDGSKTVLNMPSMLVYFKNKPGDDRYLKGMYLVKEKELDISGKVSGANSYSILVDYTGKYSIITGMPKTDDPNNIFIGTILVNKNNEIISDFIYTLPDMAYTADRGQFLLTGGEAEGCNLVAADSGDNKVNRASGFYYDEGINFPIGQTENYPIDTDNGSNFSLKAYASQSPVEKLYYMVPNNPLGNDIYVSDGLINNKYWNGTELIEVPENYFTIQQHLVTPNGQNIIIYGTNIYNSLTDAVSNLNSVVGLEINFPYIEATRIVLGNFTDNFDSKNNTMCQFFTLGRLAQVGTVSPEFADNIFKIYSGNANDTTPASIRFNLDNLEDEDFDDLYTLNILPYNTIDDLFYTDSKYIKDDEIIPVQKNITNYRLTNGMPGYNIADNHDITLIKNRIDNIEKEIWNIYDDAKFRYEQSIRYRLFNAETRLDEDDIKLTNHEDRITELENNKVKKETSINGYTLGDTNNKNETKIIDIKTGDIKEGTGQGDTINLWYTEERVSANSNVTNATTHINTISASDNATSHAVVNPHNLSTDDIKILADTTKIFVTPEEERRIRSDRLPENTIQALADLDAKNLDTISIDYMEGSSENPGAGPLHLGDIKKIRLFDDGVNMSIDSDGETLILECIGQIDDTKVMFKSRYATLEAEYPDQFGGYVDNAVNAEYAHNVHGIEMANANQYYGTNADNEVGIFDLPSYVTTVNKDSFASIDQIAFVPVDGSVLEKHLSTELADKINNNYHVVYNNGVLKSAEINTFSFGDNLSVSISGNTATINASGSGSGSGVTNFTNLADVDVKYTGNEGKTIIINEAGTGLTVSSSPSLDNYMLKAVYVDTTDISKVKKAVQADRATLAETANNALKVNNKEVDNTSTTEGLWTASQIISNTSAQIQNEGVNTYSGTSIPSDSLGKNGDIYVLIES